MGETIEPPNDPRQQYDGSAYHPHADPPVPMPLDDVIRYLVRRVHEQGDRQYGSDEADDIGSALSRRVLEMRAENPDCMASAEQIDRFVYACMKNVRKSEARKTTRARTEQAALTAQMKLEDRLDSNPDADSDFAEIATIVSAAIRDVDLDDRLPLLLSQEDQLTDVEIGWQLHISRKSVKWRIDRARGALYAALTARGLGHLLAERNLTKSAKPRASRKRRPS